MTGIITNYLTQHRRLVVPQLGTFVVKVPEGGVVFSELLRRDDGILRGLLVQQGGMNDLEAAGAIDRFVFEVRHALEHEGAYAIEGFGRLTLSPGGAIVFQAAPATSVAAGPVAGESAPEEGNKISSAAASHPASVAASAESVAPRVRSRSEAKASPVIDDGISEPRISVSAKRKPAPYVKGLQYGKPLKTTEGYTYVGSKPRRRIDKFMVIAIVVAVLAVGVIFTVICAGRRSSVWSANTSNNSHLPCRSPWLPERTGVWSPFRIRIRNSLPVLAVKPD